MKFTPVVRQWIPSVYPEIKKRPSKKFQIEELKKCKDGVKGCIYFIERYYKITLPKGTSKTKDMDSNVREMLELYNPYVAGYGIMPCVLLPIQKDYVIPNLIENRYCVVDKPRQLGMSVITGALCLWEMMFVKNSNIEIISKTGSDAKDYVRKVREGYKFLPDWMKEWISISKKVDNVMNFALDNGSRIKAGAATENAGRSATLTRIILDEAAWGGLKENAEDIFAAAEPTLANTQGSAIVLSCVVKGTYIYSKDGMRKINDFIPNNSISGGYIVPEYEILGMNKYRSSNLFKNGHKQKTRKIITKLSDLEGSLKHKLWSCKNGSYEKRSLKDLEVGDWVNIKYNTQCFGDDEYIDFPSAKNERNIAKLGNTINKDISYFLGFYLADGNASMKYRNVTISTYDDVDFMFKKLNLNYGKSDKIHFVAGSKHFVRYMESLGFDLTKKSHSKVIPDRMMRLSKESTIGMLQGLFDGDGWSDSKRGRVGISISNEEMIHQIRLLLLNLGIRSSLSKVKVDKLREYENNKNIIPNHDNYRLEVSGTDTIKFYDDIGFRIKRKHEKRINLKEENKRAKTKDVIPFSQDLVRSWRKYIDMGANEMNRVHGIDTHYFNKVRRYKTDHISKKNVEKMYDVVKEHLSQEELEHASRVLIEDSEWVQIKEIEEKENEVFDFSLIKEEGDFWYDSVIHNSFNSCQTQNGIGTWYHKLCIEAKAKENDWIHVDIPWHSFPGRDYKWIASKLRKFGRRKVAQEYLKDALGSGNTVIPTEAIEYYQSQIRTPIRTESGDRVRIYEEVNTLSAYLLGADVAQGSSADSSAFIILNADTRKIAVTFRGKLGTRAYSALMKFYASRYNTCMISVEITGCGDACREDFMSNDEELNYSNLFYRIGVDGKRERLPGWKTTSATRPLLIATLETHIGELRNVIIQDDRLISEMSTFVWTVAGRPDHEKGYHDDLLFSLMICLKSLEMSPVININRLKDPIEREKMKAEIIRKIEEKKKAMSSSFIDITKGPSPSLFKQDNNQGFKIDLLNMK